MFYVVDAEFFLVFSNGFATRAEAEVELERVKEWARNDHWEHDFIISEVVEELKPLETIDALL